MPSGLTHIEHVFGGGWEPDSGSTARVEVSKDGRCTIPWLQDAENAELELDGSPHKIGGTNLMFTPPIGLGVYSVRGLYDFWLQGVSGSPTQARYIHISDKIYKDNGDGVFAAIVVGLQNDSVPDYSAFEGQLIISQSGPDTPKVSDGLTLTDLPAGTPNFAFSTTHKLRQWAAGVDAAPSHLFYSDAEVPTDWTGINAGDIAINPGDGDRITAIASFNNELLVFKGPNKGSIHRLTGSAPLGDDAFALRPFIARGLGAVGQRTVFRFSNDLGFMWSDGSIHSINTTERYGNFLETSLSRPLNEYLRARINPNAMTSACAAVQDSLGVARISIPINSSTSNNMLLSMDFRFSPPRWTYSSVLGELCQSLAMVKDTAGDSGPRMMSGGAGVINMLDSPTKIIERWLGVLPNIDFRVVTPLLSYFNSPRMSTLYFVGVRQEPFMAGNMTLGWTRDGRNEQTKTIRQWTGDVLAPAYAFASNFTLGSSVLSGDRSITTSKDTGEGGEFQQIQYRVSSTGSVRDIHPQSILASVRPGDISMEDLA